MKIGDEVSVIDDDLKGKIIKIIADQVIIEDTHGFTYHFNKNKITMIDAAMYKNILAVRKKESTKEVSKKHKKTPLKLDLHLQKLVNNPSEYNASERLAIQRRQLVETIDFCRKNNIKKLEIIHGIGEGVLQKMVYDVLENLSGIEYDEHGFFYHESGRVEVLFL